MKRRSNQEAPKNVYKYKILQSQSDPLYLNHIIVLRPPDPLFLNLQYYRGPDPLYFNHTILQRLKRETNEVIRLKVTCGRPLLIEEYERAQNNCT